MDLFEYLDDFLGNEGFVRAKNQTWSKTGADSMLLCEFQKSKYSNAGFLNFGIYFPSLSYNQKKKTPSYDDWHAKGRFEGINEDHNFLGLFPKEIESKDDQILMEYLRKNLHDVIIPYLEKYSSLSKMKKDLADNTFDFNKMLS